MNDISKNLSSVTTRAKRKRHSAKRWISRGVLAAIVLAVASGTVYSLRPKPQLVDVAEVTEGRLDLTLDEDGRTRVRARYTVSAPLTGRVLRMGIQKGDVIAEGQIIATIVPQPSALLDGRSIAEAEARAQAASAAVQRASAAVEGAKTALGLAKAEAARARTLGSEGAISGAERDRALGTERLRTTDLSTAEFTAQVARHDAELAQVVLGRSKPRGTAKAESITVTAPASGRVLRVFQESEGVVLAGVPLVEIGDPQNLEIVVDVLTTDAVRVRPGQLASVARWGGAPLRAHVRLVEPSAVTKISALGVEEQRVDVVLDLDDPPVRWTGLGDGYRVELSIVTETFPTATLVPVGAIFRHEESNHAFVIEPDGTVRDRILDELGQGATLTAVKSGLRPGERVVLHPSDRIRDGVRVEAR